MCHNIYLVLCVLIVATCAWGRNIVSNDALVEQAYNFICDLPQPRAYSVQELTKEAYNYSPPFVVLHRCENSGCCEDHNHSCQPDDIEDVLLQISFDDNGVLSNLDVKATNHTRCICAETGTAIK